VGHTILSPTPAAEAMLLMITITVRRQQNGNTRNICMAFYNGIQELIAICGAPKRICI